MFNKVSSTGTGLKKLYYTRPTTHNCQVNDNWGIYMNYCASGYGIITIVSMTDVCLGLSDAVPSLSYTSKGAIGYWSGVPVRMGEYFSIKNQVLFGGLHAKILTDSTSWWGLELHSFRRGPPVNQECYYRMSQNRCLCQFGKRCWRRTMQSEPE